MGVLQRIEIKHRGLQFRVFDGSDSDRPNVTFFVITAFTLDSNNLWSHPEVESAPPTILKYK